MLYSLSSSHTYTKSIKCKQDCPIPARFGFSFWQTANISIENSKNLWKTVITAQRFIRTNLQKCIEQLSFEECLFFCDMASLFKCSQVPQYMFYMVHAQAKDACFITVQVIIWYFLEWPAQLLGQNFCVFFDSGIALATRRESNATRAFRWSPKKEFGWPQLVNLACILPYVWNVYFDVMEL